jgi:tetratricopeptide (TPR) repeat protein
MSRQKNIVGDLHNVQFARIGDDIHIHLPEPVFPKELTLNIPRIHPGDLVGRETDLVRLHTALQTEKRVVVVNGLGGIGKTTLAQAYLSQYYEAYQHIAWITQDSSDLARDFVNAAGLTRNLGLEMMNAGPGQVFEEIIRKLKTIGSKPNLLIIDNGEQSLKKYRHLLPGQPHWHLLVTSRETIAGFHSQSLGFLDAQQAVTLFRKHCPYKTIDDAGIAKLLKTIGYHTLTIEILAKMAALQRYDLPALQRAIQKDLKANVEIAHNQQQRTIGKIGSYMQTTFTLSRLNEEEVWTLKQLVCLPPESHTYSLLRDLLIDEKGPHAPSFAETLQRLAEKGWLSYVPSADTYSMHRIIATVILKQKSMQLGDVAHLLAMLTEKLASPHTVDNTLDKFEWVPFCKSLLAIFPKNTSPAIAMLQNRLGFVLLKLDDLAYARGILEKAIRSDEKNFGKDHPTTTMHINNLALVLHQQGKLTAARTLLEKTIRNDEKNLGPGHHHTAMRYHNLALVLMEQGDHQRAKTLLEKNLRIERKNFGLVHPSTARAYAHLALAHKNLGDLKTARTLLKKAVRVDEQYYGEGHPAIMENYNSLGVILYDFSQYTAARPLLEKALRASEKVFGPWHRETGLAYNNLSLVLSEMGEHAAAKDLLEKTLRIDEKNPGRWNDSTAITLSNLAGEMRHLGDKAAAIPLLKKAIRIFERELGVDHITTLEQYAELADILMEMDNYRAARPIQEKIVKEMEKKFSRNSFELANARYHLGLIFFNLGDMNKAAHLVKMAMPAFRKKYPAGSRALLWPTKLHNLLQTLPPRKSA